MAKTTTKVRQPQNAQLQLTAKLKVEGSAARKIDEFLYTYIHTYVCRETVDKVAEGQNKWVSRFHSTSPRFASGGVMSDDGRHCAGRHIRKWRD